MTESIRRKQKVGVVVSAKMQKTVTVLVKRMASDPTYKKYMRHQKKFLAHDEKQECKIGDRVLIRECRPLSRHKCWRVDSIVERAT